MMRRILRLFACGVLAAVAGYLFAYPLVAQAPREGPAAAFAQGASAPKQGAHYDVTPALDRYCVTCHSARLKTGGLSLEGVDPALIGQDPETWGALAETVKT